VPENTEAAEVRVGALDDGEFAEMFLLWFARLFPDRGGIALTPDPSPIGWARGTGRGAVLCADGASSPRPSPPLAWRRGRGRGGGSGALSASAKAFRSERSLGPLPEVFLSGSKMSVASPPS